METGEEDTEEEGGIEEEEVIETGETGEADTGAEEGEEEDTITIDTITTMIPGVIMTGGTTTGEGIEMEASSLGGTLMRNKPLKIITTRRVAILTKILLKSKDRRAIKRLEDPRGTITRAAMTRDTTRADTIKEGTKEETHMPLKGETADTEITGITTPEGAEEVTEGEGVTEVTETITTIETKEGITVTEEVEEGAEAEEGAIITDATTSTLMMITETIKGLTTTTTPRTMV